MGLIKAALYMNLDNGYKSMTGHKIQLEQVVSHALIICGDECIPGVGTELFLSAAPQKGIASYFSDTCHCYATHSSKADT